MRIIIALSTVAIAAAAPPAAPVVSFDPAVDFSHLHSYSWVFTSMPGGMDPNLYRQVRHAVDQSLAAHGFVQSNPGDFAVAFTVGPRDNVHPGDYGHYAPYYRDEEAASHQAWVNRELAHRSVHDHTLAIDVYDTSSKQSLWHGIAPDEIAPNMRAAVIEHEVDQVLQQFPPHNVCTQAPSGGPACIH